MDREIVARYVNVIFAELIQNVKKVVFRALASLFVPGRLIG